jgi:hypothetical protein
MLAAVPQGSILSPTWYNTFINDAPQTPDVYLALFVDDTCLYATDRKESFCGQKIPAWAQLNEDFVWALEYYNKWS